MNPEVLTQAFLARALPIFHEVLLNAIRNFHFEQYPTNAVLAGMGSVLALAMYYFLGIWLRRWPERVSTDEQRVRIEAMRKGARAWLPWLLILSPTPLGGVVVMASAFFRLPYRLVLAIVIAAEILFRAMPYLH